MSAEDIEYTSDYKEFSTKESALDWLDNYLSLDERNNLIRALQQESMLDKIRSEINGKYRVILKDTSKDDWAVKWNDCIDEVLQIIDKYREVKK